MITLQTSFVYADGADPPVDTASINIAFPQFSFSETLSVTGQGSVNFEQQLSNKQYHANIPTSGLFGTAYGFTVAQYFTYLRDTDRPIALKDLSVTFFASYGGDIANTVELEGLYFLKLLTPTGTSEESDNPRAASLLMATSSVRDPSQLVDENIYAVNKQAYVNLLRSLFSDLRTADETILLYLINAVLDLKSGSPVYLPSQENQALEVVLKHYGMDTGRAATIRKALLANFTELFDFPLQMPEVKMLKIAGVVRIIDDNVEFSDFTLCTLSAELSTNGSPHVLHLDWDKENFDNDRIGFNFPEQYIQSSVTGAVVIKVTAFDNTSLYFAQFKASDPTLQSLVIAITPKKPSVLQPAPVRAAEPTKIRGQIVSLAPNPETLQGVVIVQAKKTIDGEWITVASAMSDRIGNFSMPYPSGKYVDAQARVSLDPESVTAIGINDSSISSDFIYILLQAPAKEPEKKDECKCEQKPTTGRLPSQEDLVQSDQYTQDIGGSCLNLNTPNRTLREYNYQAIVRTSDPDVANYSLRSETDATGSRSFLMANHGKVNRKVVDLDNPIRWQDDEDDALVQNSTIPIFRNPMLNLPILHQKPEVSISLYQAVTVATGHTLHYKSEFKADGYSLGDLLYSVPLGPGQKKQIVIFDSSHSFTGSEDQNISQSESLASSLLNERSIMDQIAGNIGEMTRGQSEASTWGVSGAVGASGSSGFIGASAGVAGGYSNAKSDASQDSNRNLSQYFGEQLRQSINQNASSYRKLTASAVTTVKEGQQYNAETTVIANHNHCHSLTMMYFEVLRHFAIFQELVDVEECVFVPFLMTKFTSLNVSKWADVLVTKLLPLHSNTYLTPYTHPTSRAQHPLIPAFDAVERIRTKYAMVDYPEGSFDQETIRQVQGNMVIHVDLPRPKSRYDNIMSLPIITKTISHEETDLGDAVKTVAVGILAPWSLFDGPQTHTVTEQVQAKKQIFDQFMTLDANYESVPPPQCIRINSFLTININGIFSGTIDPIELLSMSPENATLWRVYAYCHGYGDSNLGVAKMMDLFFRGQLLSEWDTIFQSQIAPKVFEYIVSTINFDIILVDTTVDSRYNGGERYMNVPFNGKPGGMKRSILQGLTLKCFNTTVKRLQSNAMFNLRSCRISYSTNHFQGVLFNGSPNGDILDEKGVYMDMPETWEEKRDPRKEDIFIVNRLIDHLNFNLEYYNRMLWYSLDSERRWLLLDGFKIQIFDQNGNPEVPESYRSLASVLKNNLIAVTGNSLVFPVAPGFRVNRALIVANNEPGESLLDRYKPLVPTPPYRLSVPTRGVYAESVLGSCDSCEKLKPDSSQDWTKFTTDEPTPIAQVTPPVPVITDYKAAFEKLANPLISIQNAPGVPDPGAGLAASTDLLGKTGLFKDITGLDANQSNAIRTYLSNNDNVRAIASMANGLAIQSANMENSARFMETAASANDKGILSNDDYGKLVKQHLQQQVDGGASLNAELENQKAGQNPSLEGAAVQAVKDGKEVKAVTTDADGNTHSIDVKSTLGFAISDPDAGAGDGGGGATDTFSIGKGKDYVAEFNSFFHDNMSTVTSGQFQIYNIAHRVIADTIAASLQSQPDAGLKAIWDSIINNELTLGLREVNQDIKQYIESKNLWPKYRRIEDLYKDYTGPSVETLYGNFWWPLEVKRSPDIPNATFSFLEVVYQYERSKCGFTANLLGRKYVQAKNKSQNLPPSITFDHVIDGTTISPVLPMGKTSATQTLTYNTASLNSYVKKINNSFSYKTPAGVAAPRPVVAGVLSGRNHVDNGVPFTLEEGKVAPEHFILIIGHEPESDRYIFWDSDFSESNIKSSGNQLGEGFGVLFARKSGKSGKTRFGTAFSDDDFDQLDDVGVHTLEKTRHRYQVYYVRNGLTVDPVGKLGYDPAPNAVRRPVTYKYQTPP